MTQENQKQPPQVINAGPTRVNLRELATGEKVRLSEGDIIVEVIENPQDGMWIRGKYVSVPGNAKLEGTEAQIFANEITDKA